LHVPDSAGEIDTKQYIDAGEMARSVMTTAIADIEQKIMQIIEEHLQQGNRTAPADGMMRLITRLLRGNLAQIEYVKQFHGGSYADVGHQECFIGMGIGFEEIQLRNLTYFAYLKTVEEGAKDLDVGIKIFSKLNVARGLPVPVVIRFDYHGQVPDARERAEARCQQLDMALRQRFHELTEQGLLHTLLMVRDCNANLPAEVIGCSVSISEQEMH
jgi:carboxysome shell carbonic anhydrase